jgi:hypothetical protein
MSELTSYGEWMFSRHRANLPINVPTPAGVETYEAWYRRIRGLSELAPSPAAAAPTSKLAAMTPVPSMPVRGHSAPRFG